MLRWGMAKKRLGTTGLYGGRWRHSIVGATKWQASDGLCAEVPLWCASRPIARGRIDLVCLEAFWLQEWEWVMEDSHERSCWKNSIGVSVPRPCGSDVYVCSKSFRLCLTVVCWLLECNKVPSWIENLRNRYNIIIIIISSFSPQWSIGPATWFCLLLRLVLQSSLYSLVLIHCPSPYCCRASTFPGSLWVPFQCCFVLSLGGFQSVCPTHLYFFFKKFQLILDSAWFFPQIVVWNNFWPPAVNYNTEASIYKSLKFKGYSLSNLPSFIPT
jgi:hypothetical protein